MEIRFKREKKWLEITPTLAISWHSGIDIYIGWLFFNIFIRIK